MEVGRDLATLGLCSDASLEDVQRAYKRMALEHHPDRGGDKEAFQRIKASADRLSAGLSGSLAEHFGGGTVSQAHGRCRDNVRCLVFLSGALNHGAPTLLMLDEQQVLMSSNCHEWVALQADGEAFLCCCVFNQQGEQHVAVGSSRGRVHLMSSECGSTLPQLAPIAAGDGPLVALVCTSEGSSLLLASVAGRIALIDHVTGCVLRSLETVPALNGVVAEALCQSIARRAGASSALELGSDSSPCTAAVCIAGGDEQGCGGVLVSLRLDLNAFVAGDQNGAAAVDALQLDWRATHDAPIYAVAAAPSFLVAATGHVCMLHQRDTGALLQRMTAGCGVLYALAISPAGDCLLAAGSEEVVHAFNFPSGTKRAELPLPRSSARDCSLNSATINALAFVDGHTFFSGGYDKATTRWQLSQPPRPPAVRAAHTLTSQGRGAV